MVNKDQYFDNDTITLGQWITTYLLMCIPIIGIVMLFVWAFSNSVNPSKKTWAQCVLILMLFVLVVSTILWSITGWSFISFFSK